MVREVEKVSLGASQTYPRPQNNLVGKLGLGGLSGRNTISEQELFGPIKLSGRALYDDGKIINSNVINHKRALELKLFSTNMATAGELRCYDSAIESVLEDIDSAFILKEEQRNAITSFLRGLVKV